MKPKLLFLSACAFAAPVLSLAESPDFEERMRAFDRLMDQFHVSTEQAKGLCGTAPLPTNPQGASQSVRWSYFSDGFRLTAWRLRCSSTTSVPMFTINPDPGADPFICSAQLTITQGSIVDGTLKLTEDPANDGDSQCDRITSTTTFGLVKRSISEEALDLNRAFTVAWDLGNNDQTLNFPAFNGDGGTSNTIANQAGVSGIYYDDNTPGQGWNFQRTTQGLTLFFYGHGSTGQRLWLVSGTRATAIRYGEPFTLELFEIIDGTFGAPGADLTRWGTVRVTQTDCEHATAVLNGQDGSQTMNLIKLDGIAGLTCG